MQLIFEWFKRTFSDPQLVVLLLLLVGGFAIIITMGDMLAPLLASIVIAYLLEGLITLMGRWGMPRVQAGVGAAAAATAHVVPRAASPDGIAGKIS